MEVTLALLLQCVLEPSSTVAQWTTGFSLTRGLGPSAWFVDYELEEDWVHLSAPLVGGTNGIPPGMRRACLARNATSGVLRYGFAGGLIVARADYPTPKFRVEEFRHIHSLFWKQLAAAARELGIDAQPTGART